MATEAWLDAMQILASMLRLATPLIFCAMAGMFSERAGVVDIGLEGKLLMGAFAAAAVTSLTGTPWAGLAAAIGASVALALVHGFACITHRGDHIVSGVAINILASGLTVVIGIALFTQGGQTPPLSREERFGPITLPFADRLADVPWFGPFYAELLSGHNLLVYAATLAVPLSALILFSTTFGLRLRAVGEAPEAVDSAGYSVAWLRYRAVIITGILCGMAGAYLSTAHGGGFVREMSAGKGYIALAALIFGKWRPVPTLFACLLFGVLESSAARMSGVSLPLVGQIPIEVILVAPYVLTVILLAGFFGRAIPPRALGVPYMKER
ncbi:sugar ABC transporter permease [Acuticoccus sediminis]|uniref:Sugar ABC transporter permease n=1 Tax=Acuticoccus sediminis TaxID=2184697 RepID=A0A8B2P0A8_9HYPH|nr:ABC transporter permease [Acuticoccus sediminis]RAI03576.1 sugar ABC transporter permease [Acuticoccus sediminis]